MKRLLIIPLFFALAACGARAPAALQGYGEADYIYLASQEAGMIGELFVREGDHVEPGQAVFSLDRERLALNAQSASAQAAAAAQAVRTAQAEAALAQSNFERGQELFQRGFYPQARLDSDRASRDAANARLAQARREAGAASAQTSLAQTRVGDLSTAAPRAGVIERIYYRPGEVIAAGAPVAALLAPENMKVRFFAPQDRLAQFPVGARVLVSCDGCGAPAEAIVSYAASEPQFTPPIIYSVDQRQKLVFLIEARLAEPGRIRPGMPVDVAPAP
ncbi:MAG TPA: efflux RND transporter periplasmic adaptor subunit [Terricaulis sp.]|nr:efflux RND transporter periplasmic adaptor subunit [Terricaulis sp.]